MRVHMALKKDKHCSRCVRSDVLAVLLPNTPPRISEELFH